MKPIESESPPEPPRGCAGDLAPLKARLFRARASLVEESPFLGALVLKLPLVITEDPRVGTACVDGRGVCYFGKAFLEALDLAALRAVLLHETLHLALDAFPRCGGRRPLRWNVAHDFAINLLIEESDFGQDFLSLPARFRPLLDVKYKGLPAEEIYEALPRDLGELGLGDRDCLRDAAEGMNQGDEVGDLWFDGWAALAEAEREALRESWREKLLEAAEQAMQGDGGFGQLPGWARKLLGPLLNPQIPWQAKLAQKIHGHLKGGRRSFARPGRRSQSVGAVLPGPLRDRGPVGVFVDVSGSVGPVELGAFMGELVGILQGAELPVRLITWDVNVQEDLLLDHPEDIRGAIQQEQLVLAGGGGTDPRCVIERLLETGASGAAPVSFGVLLTDGFVPWPAAEDWPIDLLVVCCRSLPPPECGYDALSISPGEHHG